MASPIDLVEIGATVIKGITTALVCGYFAYWYYNSRRTRLVGPIYCALVLVRFEDIKLIYGLGRG